MLCIVLFISTTLLNRAHALKATPVTTGLDHPWSMAFLPDGEVIISERSGSLRRVVNGKLIANEIDGVPYIQQHGQGGLMGLAIHPNFAKNRWLYLAYSGQDERGFSTHLARGRYQDGKLTQVQDLFAATPKSMSRAHFGGRVLFDKQGYLYLTLGDRGRRQNSQNASNHAGSVIRLHDDGRVPNDNPFVSINNLKPEIYSFGHRNIQGAAIHPVTGHLWTHEHGPKGGDELNLVKPGANYGWPIITYGKEYSGGKVGDGLKQKPGLQQPLYYWDPSIAPSGMTFVSGDKYPQWQGDVLVGALKFQLIAHLKLNGNQVTQETRHLEGDIGRIRDIQQAPDGFIYLLTDESNGGLYRLEP